MAADSKIFDDLARMAGGAFNILGGLREQIREDIKSRVEEMAARMDLVPREDLDRAEAMISTLQDKVANMDKRLAMLEKGKPAAKKKTVKGKKKRS